MQLYATFGVEVAKLRASPPQALALPADVVYHRPEDLELPMLPTPVKVEVELAGVKAEEEGKTGLLVVETVAEARHEAEDRAEVTHFQQSVLVKVEASG
jgi:hypothetical protein